MYSDALLRIWSTADLHGLRAVGEVDATNQAALLRFVIASDEQAMDLAADLAVDLTAVTFVNRMLTPRGWDRPTPTLIVLETNPDA